MTELVTHGSIVPLTEQELNALNEMLSSGDRAGFYLTYYAMTGSQEALLQAKIATFSGDVGGEAFAANVLLQEAYGQDGTEVPGTYPGIYYLSQQVARSAFNAISLSSQSPNGVGVVDDATIFASASAAWTSEEIGRLFPGNILSGDYDVKDSPGGVFAFDALPYASYFGKQASDYPANQRLTLAGGLSVAVDGSGKIVAVFTSVPQDDEVALAAASSGFLADPTVLDNLFGGVMPSSTTDQSAIVVGLTEGNTGYNGDVDPELVNPEHGSLTYAAAEDGTDGADLLLASGSANGGGGDDIIIGDDTAQTLTGGSGNDIIWGRNGVDHLEGGDGDDTLRGGGGNDFITGGAGDDFIDGGDINLSQDEDGIDTAIFDDRSGGIVDLDSQGAASSSSSRAPFLLIKRGDEVDTLHSIERIVLSGGADTLRVDAGANLVGIQEIDAGANPAGTQDTLDLSAYSGKLELKNGNLIGDGINIQLDNFEKVVGLSSEDQINLTGTSIRFAQGDAGDDTIIGGNLSAVLLGNDGNDTLIAGSAGDTLDSSIGDGIYVGGAGSDTFVIGNGEYAKQGANASFVIKNASAADRLVLRLDDTVGFANASSWTQGIVLSGGVYGTAENSNSADSISAFFSPVLVIPTAYDFGPPGSDFVKISATELDYARPELGNFKASYYWDRTASTLDIQIQSAYGNFSVHVENFQNGQLGLNFIGVPARKTSGPPTEAERDAIQASWDTYNAALLGFVQSTQIVDIASPGDPVAGNVAPTIPDYGDGVGSGGNSAGSGGSAGGFSGTNGPGQTGAAGGLSGVQGFGSGGQLDFMPAYGFLEAAPWHDHSIFLNGLNPLGERPLIDGYDWTGWESGRGFLPASLPRLHDPLVLDLTGAGLQLTPLKGSPAHFDFTGSGFASQTGWIGSGQGLLIRNRSTIGSSITSNDLLGAINDDGFADLATLDSNADGVIDAGDSSYSQIGVWVDQDGDGSLDAGELKSLADLNITSISLATTPSALNVNGNLVVAQGSFVVGADSSHPSTMAEVNFSTSTVQTVYSPPAGFVYAPDALTLPELSGYGVMPNLRVSMSLDTSLLSEAQTLVGAAPSVTGALRRFVRISSVALGKCFRN
jgi:Ca2+-binding RTX toxin-like protein